MEDVVAAGVTIVSVNHANEIAVSHCFHASPHLFLRKAFLD